MKYLKRFNEELLPQTYNRAARKLDKLGHTDRAKDLKDWSKKRQKDMDIEAWKENIEQMSKFGKFKLNIFNPGVSARGKKMTGDFYLSITFDGDSFIDSCDEFVSEGRGSIPFFIGIIPVDQDVVDKCENTMPSPGESEGNGFYWGMYLSLSFTLSGNVLKFNKYELGDYDPGMSGNVSFADRASAGRFKSLLKNIFIDENLNYPSGRTDVPYIYQAIQNVVCIEAGFSSDYGFNVEQADDFINTMSPNEMYKSI